MNGSPPPGNRELLSEWKEYFSCLLSNVQSSIEDPPKPAKQKPAITTEPSTVEETKKAIKQLKIKKAAGLDDAIMAEAL